MTNHEVIRKDETSITINHGILEDQISAAYLEADNYCASLGLRAKKSSTDCPLRCVSDFDCVN